MTTFFENLGTGNYTQAYKAMKKLGILPLDYPITKSSEPSYPKLSLFQQFLRLFQRQEH